MDTNWHQKEPSRALKLQIFGAEIWNWARNEKWYKNDINSREGQNFDIISQLYHPLKNDIKISLSSKKPTISPWAHFMCMVLLPIVLTHEKYDCFKCNTRLYVWIPGHMTAFLHYYWRLPHSRLTSLPCHSRTTLSLQVCRACLIKIRIFFTASSKNFCLPTRFLTVQQVKMSQKNVRKHMMAAP
jgi:hypothetical protein